MKEIAIESTKAFVDSKLNDIKDALNERTNYFKDALLKCAIESIYGKMLPKENGEWSGEVGNSIWFPDRDYIPKRPPGNKKTWGKILDEYGIEGIRFKDGEPDFSTIAEANVEIGDFSTDRNANFTQADEKLAQKWSIENKEGKQWTPEDVAEYRKENKLSWHERSDMKTLDLVPQEIHGNIPHSGGISAKKGELNA